MAGQTALWLLSVYLDNCAVVDTAWGLVLAGYAWSYYALDSADGCEIRSQVALICTGIWAVRLAFWIGRRNGLYHKDPRYVSMKKNAPVSESNYWWYSWLQVFLLQTVIAGILSLPIAALTRPSETCEFGLWEIVAVVVWAIGFLGEAIADAQLKTFLDNPANKTKVLNTGLWRYSRHPNYFFDTIVWLGMCILAAAHGYLILGGVVYALWNYCIIKISGVSLTEHGMAKRSKREGHAEYVATTSVFVPWPPKKVEIRPKSG